MNYYSYFLVTLPNSIIPIFVYPQLHIFKLSHIPSLLQMLNWLPVSLRLKTSLLNAHQNHKCSDFAVSSYPVPLPLANSIQLLLMFIAFLS